MKAGRTLGLVQWDFAVRSVDGVLLRRRKLGQDADKWSWFYLPPLTKKIFDQCSGAWSCEQITARLNDREPAGQRATPDQVVDSCTALVRMGIVDWIDDIHLREQRRREFSIADPG